MHLCIHRYDDNKKGKNEWVGKVIDFELFKRFKFHKTDKWYRPKLESVLESEMPKIFCNFNIEVRHQIWAMRPQLVVISKKKICFQNIRWVVTNKSRVYTMVC